MEPVADNWTDRPGTMYEVVLRWAKRTPGAPAVVAPDRSPLTYRDLLTTVDGIGATLNGCGFGRSDRVAVVHPAGPDMAVTIVGVWSHATAVPLNPAYTAAEFAMHFRDLGIRVVAVAAGMDTPARAAARMLAIPVLDIVPHPGDGAKAVRLEGTMRGVARQPGPAAPDDVALVLTTSGTTSHSKIVPIRHRQIVYRAERTARDPALGAADRCLVLNQLFHHAGIVTGCCTALSTGGSFGHLTDFSVGGFFRDLARVQPTWCTGSHAFYASVFGHAAAHTEEIARASGGLKWFRVGNGRFEPDEAAAVEVAFGASVITAYGTSETGTLVTEPLAGKDRKRGSVGTPIYQGVAILGEGGQALGPRAVGEVAARGPMVFDGYENDPEANRAAFTNGWFRTGDQGYLDEDGYLFLTGRIKEMINRGGEKITPNEVDRALLEHPDVSAAAAFAIPHPSLGEDVAAAVVAKAGAALTERALARFLRDRLADFKVPRRFVFVDEIPTSATGKIQRNQLAAAFGLDGAGEADIADAADRAAASRPPTALEARLAAVWAETLGLERVGLHTTFFDLGGDSLLAVELFLRIEETLGCRLPRSVLFEAATVAEMADHIEKAAPSRCLAPIQPDGERPIFFGVHDVNGEVLNFRALARHLGEDQPFYGIQSIGLDGTETPLARIEDMAARYIAEIRRVQPAGPYYLGGYSMGGLIAYEMARQLNAAGHAVGLIALFDTSPSHGIRRTGLSGWFEQGGNLLADRKPLSIAKYTGRGFLNLAWVARAGLWRRLFAIAWRLCAHGAPMIPRWLCRPVALNLMAIRSYRLRPYAGDVVLFAAERYAWDRRDPHAGWRALVRGDLGIRPIEGRHHEILEEPYVRGLARKLSDCLRERRTGAT